MRIALILALFLGGCTSNFDCRRDAYAADSHVNPAQGFLGNLTVSAINQPRPHPPLDAMLAACENVK